MQEDNTSEKAGVNIVKEIPAPDIADTVSKYPFSEWLLMAKKDEDDDEDEDEDEDEEGDEEDESDDDEEGGEEGDEDEGGEVEGEGEGDDNEEDDDDDEEDEDEDDDEEDDDEYEDDDEDEDDDILLFSSTTKLRSIEPPSKTLTRDRVTPVPAGIFNVSSGHEDATYGDFFLLKKK